MKPSQVNSPSLSFYVSSFEYSDEKLTGGPEEALGDGLTTW